MFAGYEPGVPIVRGASIHVSRGEIVAILGPNGAGKSTLIKAIAGIVPKFSGRCLLDGEDITHRKAHEMVRSGLAFVPQTENVFAAMTVEENLQIAAAMLPKARAALAHGGGARSLSRSRPADATSAPAGSPADSGRCWRSPAR